MKSSRTAKRVTYPAPLFSAMWRARDSLTGAVIPSSRYDPIVRSREWTARAVAQLVGWGSIIFGIVFVFGGFVGEGGGAGHEPGTDTVRTLIFEKGVGHLALAATGLGGVVLLASLFMRKPTPGPRPRRIRSM
jgi:hypothetical protein